MADLHTAIERLRQFRMTFNEDDLVDEESGLTAADLATIVTHCQATENMPPASFSEPSETDQALAVFRSADS